MGTIGGDVEQEHRLELTAKACRSGEAQAIGEARRVGFEVHGCERRVFPGFDRGTGLAERPTASKFDAFNSVFGRGSVGRAA
jgi:hypothetical protein